jgi:hypothetical protein
MAILEQVETSANRNPQFKCRKSVWFQVLGHFGDENLLVSQLQSDERHRKSDIGD